MGTRNLTIVISNGQTKVAQYGQWDGYPSGQGQTALKFLRSVNINEFKKKLDIVKFAGKKEEKQKDNFLKSIGSKDGWVTMEQSAKYNAKYPFDSRDHGAAILEMIMNSKEKEIILTDSSDFANDSLFCEWAYVIDLDKNTFEVYKGFNTSRLPKKERFASNEAQPKEGKYYPVKSFKTYKLSKLPTIDQFLKIEKEEEEAA